MVKKGGTPSRNEIIFISPTGEEIKNKKQLAQYLKSHPEGPKSSEFDWGTGDTPRRSARLGEKAKAAETPEGEKPIKRERKSTSKKGAKDKMDNEEADVSTEAKEDTTKEEAKDASADVEMKETDSSEEKAEDVAVEVPVDKDAKIEFAPDRGVATEITTVAVIQSAIEQNSENKIEDIAVKPMESILKEDEKENATNADVNASDVTGDKTVNEVKPAESGALPLPINPKEVTEVKTTESETLAPPINSKEQTEGKPTESEALPPPVHHEEVLSSAENGKKN